MMRKLYLTELDIEKYLAFSNKKLTGLFMTYKEELKDSIYTYNIVCEIGKSLTITKDSYYKKELIKIDDKRYIEGTIEDAQQNFESEKLQLNF